MKKLRTHYKAAIALIMLAVLLFVASFIATAISSYLIIAGIALLLAGLFLIDPSYLPF